MSTNHSKSLKPNYPLLSPTLAILPLSLSVIPWAILCGTLSIEAGLTSFEAQLMSLIVFAGATQLSGIAILGSMGSWLALFNSTSMISVRHILYSATYKEEITPLPLYKRVLFAFLLTDEMFVVAQAEQLKTGRFDYTYAVIAGLVFYAIWNIGTLVGILSAHLLGDIEKLGFDFAIAATFIAMVVPMIKTRPIAVAVIVSAISAYIFELVNMSNGLMFSALMGMAVGGFLSAFEDRSTDINNENADTNLKTSEQTSLDTNETVNLKSSDEGDSVKPDKEPKS